MTKMSCCFFIGFFIMKPEIEKGESTMFGGLGNWWGL